MSTQMLLYQDPVAVSRTRHRGCSVEVRGYGFCRKVNSVPLLAVEFRAAAREYPVVFAGAPQAVRPVVVLGLRRDENLYAPEQGAWQGRYVPAFLRRYPFVFSAGGQGQRLVLCVDEAFAGLNREGRGEALFGPDGQPSPYVDKVLHFLQAYRAQFLRTQAMCRQLEELALLEPMGVRMAFGGGQLALGGFMTVNRDKLKALPGERLAQLAAGDTLELLYLHLQSLGQFEALRARLPMPVPPLDDLPAMAPEPGAPGQRITVH